MKINTDFLTIELVGYGHPDRFADLLSEKISQLILKNDQKAKTAVEVIITRNIIFLGGEISTIFDYEKNIEKWANDLLFEVYGEYKKNIKKEFKIINNIKKQSPELNKIQKKKIVAGDQGVVFGYFNPKREFYIKKLYDLISVLRKKFPEIWPDWKLLFNINENKLSISFCGLKKEKFKNVKKEILKISKKLHLEIKNVILNSGGEWMIGGPYSDTGLTGRKLMIDTFGAGIPHGGGAFCGKDFSKIDKTGIIYAYKYAKIFYENIFNKEKEEILIQINFKLNDEKPDVILNNHIFRAGEKNSLNIEFPTFNNFIKEEKLLEKDNFVEMVKKGGIIFYD